MRPTAFLGRRLAQNRVALLDHGHDEFPAEGQESTRRVAGGAYRFTGTAEQHRRPDQFEIAQRLPILLLCRPGPGGVHSLPIRIVQQRLQHCDRRGGICRQFVGADRGERRITVRQVLNIGDRRPIDLSEFPRNDPAK